MGVRTCFGGKMSHLACVFIRGGIGGNMVETLSLHIFWKFIFYIVFLRSMVMKKKMDYIWFIRVNGMHHTVCSLTQ